jgi:hypothetical protein
LERSYCKEAGIVLKGMLLLFGILLISWGFSLDEDLMRHILVFSGGGCVGAFGGILDHELRKR